MKSKFKFSSGLIISVLFAVLLFLSRYGWPMLNPSNIEWLMTEGSDWTPDFLAWIFYKNEPWTFPLGVFEGYSMPGKVSIGLTGAIPVLAVPFKAISPWLPFEFQYFGIWMLLCFILHAYFSYKLLDRFDSINGWQTIIGACIMTLSYSFLDRVGHLNLCAHWLIIAGIYVFFEYRDFQAFWRYAILIFLSVWIHPYLILFTLGISFAHFCTYILERPRLFGKTILYTIGSVGVAILAWVLIGNHVLGTGDSVSLGLGTYSANLNTFWNPKLDSYFMNHVKYAFEGQYEGLAYLGLGFWLGLIIISILFIIKKSKITISTRTWALFGMGLLFFIFSLSHVITFNDKVLFEIPLPSPVLKLASSFRATGRYVWLLQYLLVLTLIVLLSRLPIKTKFKNGILALILLLNLIDFANYIERVSFLKKDKLPFSDFNFTFWEEVISSTDTLRMFPPHTRTYHKFGDDTPFVLLAGKNQLDINTGHLARYDSELRKTHFNELEKNLLHHPRTFRNTTLISTENEILKLYPLWKENSHEIFKEDGFLVFIPKDKPLIPTLKNQFSLSHLRKAPEYLGDFIERHRENTILMAVRDEASSQLKDCKHFVSRMDSLSSHISELQFRESYVGMIHQDELIREIFGSQNDKGLSKWDTTFNNKKIQLFSASMNNGNEARIFVNGINYSVNSRGLNIVVIGPNGSIIERTHFDTYQHCFQIVEKDSTQYKLWIRD